MLPLYAQTVRPRVKSAELASRHAASVTPSSIAVRSVRFVPFCLFASRWICLYADLFVTCDDVQIMHWKAIHKLECALICAAGQ
jgi:hypothetical protein